MASTPNITSSSPPPSPLPLATAFYHTDLSAVYVQDIPFLRFLLEGSSEDSVPTDSGGGGSLDGEAKDDESRAPSASTFLCLHLAGDGASPLFEVACRALFRLRPRQLPRFVERLARFRTYADEMKDGIDGNADGDVDEEGRSSARDERTASTVTSDRGGEDSRDDRNSLLHRGRSTPRGSESTPTTRRDVSPGSATTVITTDDKADVAFSSLRSLSPARRRRRRTSDDSSLDGLLAPEVGAAHGRKTSTRRRSEGMSPDRSPERRSFSSGVAVSTATDGVPTTEMREEPLSTLPSPTTAQTYFLRTLACLPPANEDDTDGRQRRARLSLLMGARMFTETSRLLRARAWEDGGMATDGGVDKDGKPIRDQGAAGAWSAAMRLLGELKRAAEEEEEAVSRRLASTFPDGRSVAASTGEVAVAAVQGGAPLQYRLAFEDALAETILADDPGRMETVMTHRPTGLTPVAVVRMVRRAAELTTTVEAKTGVRTDVGAALSSLVTADAGEEGNTVIAGNRSGRLGQQIRQGHPTTKMRPGAQPLAGSTRTLKKCLLLLVESNSNVADTGAPSF